MNEQTNQQSESRRQQHGGGPDEPTEKRRTTLLDSNIRNVRALLDQARQNFGPDTRRIVDEITKQTEGVPNLETINLDQRRLDPAAWTYLALVQTIETVNAIVVQLSSSPAFASAMMSDRDREAAGTSSR